MLFFVLKYFLLSLPLFHALILPPTGSFNVSYDPNAQDTQADIISGGKWGLMSLSVQGRNASVFLFSTTNSSFEITGEVDLEMECYYLNLINVDDFSAIAYGSCLNHSMILLFKINAYNDVELARKSISSNKSDVLYIAERNPQVGPDRSLYFTGFDSDIISLNVDTLELTATSFQWKKSLADNQLPTSLSPIMFEVLGEGEAILMVFVDVSSAIANPVLGKIFLNNSAEFWFGPILVGLFPDQGSLGFSVVNMEFLEESVLSTWNFAFGASNESILFPGTVADVSTSKSSLFLKTIKQTDVGIDSLIHQVSYDSEGQIMVSDAPPLERNFDYSIVDDRYLYFLDLNLQESYYSITRYPYN